jgi:hypothetical protein
MPYPIITKEKPMSYQHDPKGIARSNYRRPCPGCHQPIVMDEPVRKVFDRWWHQACRTAYVRHLLEEEAEVVSVPTPGTVAPSAESRGTRSGER